jgi:hypothetical protein
MSLVTTKKKKKKKKRCQWKSLSGEMFLLYLFNYLLFRIRYNVIFNNSNPLEYELYEGKEDNFLPFLGLTVGYCTVFGV